MEGDRKKIKLRDFLSTDQSTLFYNRMLAGLPQHVWTRIIVDNMNTVRDVEMLCSTNTDFRKFCIDGGGSLWYAMLQRQLQLTDDELSSMKMRFRYVRPKNLLLAQLAVKDVDLSDARFTFDPKGVEAIDENMSFTLTTNTVGMVLRYTRDAPIILQLIRDLVKRDTPWVTVHETVPQTMRLGNVQHAQLKLLILIMDIFFDAGFASGSQNMQLRSSFICQSCETVPAFVACARCNDAFYCNMQCARDDWHAIHKHNCMIKK